MRFRTIPPPTTTAALRSALCAGGAAVLLAGCGSGGATSTQGVASQEPPNRPTSQESGDGPQRCGEVEGRFVVRAEPNLGCASAITAAEEIIDEDGSTDWNCLFIGDEAPRFCNQGEEAAYSTAPLFIEELSGGDSAALAPTNNGTAQLTTNSGLSHGFQVVCAGVESSIFVATPNIDMEAKSDGSYTDSLFPDDEGPFMYLIDDPTEGSVTGTRTEYFSPQEAEHLNVQGSFGGDQGFGGSLDYLASATLFASNDGSRGELQLGETDGSTFTLKWQC